MVTTKQQILDIAMNLHRIGNWSADGYDAKQKRILLFLSQTSRYIATIDTTSMPPSIANTFNTFKPIFRELYREGQSKPDNTDIWAETMMTWGNILTHRASLLDEV
jgi:hypothetical protein